MSVDQFPKLVIQYFLIFPFTYICMGLGWRLHISGVHMWPALAGVMCPWWHQSQIANTSEQKLGLVADMSNKYSGGFLTPPNMLPGAICHEKKNEMCQTWKKLLNNKSNCCHKQVSWEVMNSVTIQFIYFYFFLPQRYWQKFFFLNFLSWTMKNIQSTTCTV